MPTFTTIYEEHNHIFSLLTDLKAQAEDHPPTDIAADSAAITGIGTLLEYAAMHFTHEEEMMKNLNFFDYDGHCETHALFNKMAAQLYNTLLDDPSYIEDVIRIFTNWFKTHIEIETFLFARAVSRANRKSTT